MADGMDEFLRRPVGRPPVIPFECEITTGGVNSPLDQVDVVEINGNKMVHRDCRWARHWGPDGAEYPAKGDLALVLISDEDRPWIVEWTDNA